MDYYSDDETSVGDKITEAASKVYEDREGLNYYALLERLRDRPDLHRGLNKLSALELLLATTLDDETLVRVVAEGMAYDKRHLALSEAEGAFCCERDELRRAFEEEQDARRKAYEDLNDDGNEAFIEYMDENVKARETLDEKIGAAGAKYFALRNACYALDNEPSIS